MLLHVVKIGCGMGQAALYLHHGAYMQGRPGLKSRTSCCRELDKWLEPDTFRALGEPSRAALLMLLAGTPGPRSVGELAAELPIDLSVVSRHLKVLKDVGVVTAERSGKEVRYRLACGDLVRMLRNLADALESCCPTGITELEVRR